MPHTTKDRSQLGERQRQALELFEADPPLETSEIAKRLGISDNGVYQHKRRLIEAGFLPKDSGRASRSRRRKASPKADGQHFKRVARTAEEEMRNIDAELQAIDRQIEDLQAQVKELRERKKKLRKDRDALMQVAQQLPDD